MDAGTSCSRCRRRRSRSTSTASPSGRSSTRPGPACRSTSCSRASRPRRDYVTAWSDGGYTTNLAARGHHGRQGVGRRTTYDGEPLEPEHGGPARLLVPAPVLLEEREVAARADAHRRRRARLLGVGRLPQLRRPVARAAVLGRLSGAVAGGRRPSARSSPRSPRARTLVLDVPDWPGHRAGQHVDVRLTAEDGYQAQRSYSIASAPEARRARADGRAGRGRRGVGVPRRGAAQAGDAVRAARPDRRPLHLVGRRWRAAAAGRRRLRAGAADVDAAPPRGARERRRRRTCSCPSRSPRTRLYARRARRRWSRAPG